jgi:UDP-glucose 4-epimerase
MKNVCITGVSGYLGMRLLNMLSANEAIGSIVGVDIVPPSNGSEKLSFYKMDIRDSRIGQLMSRQDIDTVLHLAFVVKPIHDRKLMYDVDFNGTRNILDKANAAGVKHLIAVSSTLAYGAHKDNPHELKETDPLRGNKIFPYGHNKALVDEMIQGFATEHPEIVITILRPCTVLGPNVDNYVSRMLFRPLAVSVLGYNAAVQFLHEDDFVKACLKAMERQVPGAFNIAGDGTLTTGEVARMIGTKLIPLPSWILYPLLELLWRLHFPGIEVNRGYLDYVRYAFVAGTEKARKGMDFRPEYSSLETVQDTVVRKKMLGTSGPHGL